MESPDRALPNVLWIDDLPDDQTVQRDNVNADGLIFVELMHPDGVTAGHLASASLVLVDFKIDVWPSRAAIEAIALKPVNGLALVSVLQEHTHSVARKTPCAFALHTGRASELQHALAKADHLAARAHNLDWIFPKSDPQTRWNQITQLASAVSKLPSAWSLEDHAANFRALCHWLGLKDPVWAERARRDIEDCHPPIHEFAATTHGGAIVRWMLHRILPYPCFLLDRHHLAMRLRVTPESLSEALRAPAFEAWLGDAKYDGELRNFVGPRWWRAAVEGRLFDLSPDDPANDSVVFDRLRSVAPMLCACGAKEPVVAVDEDYQPLPRLYDVREAVRIAPDDWPAFADAAWTALALASDDPRLGAIVVRADRSRLPSAS